MFIQKLCYAVPETAHINAVEVVDEEAKDR